MITPVIYYRTLLVRHPVSSKVLAVAGKLASGCVTRFFPDSMSGKKSSTTPSQGRRSGTRLISYPSLVRVVPRISSSRSNETSLIANDASWRSGRSDYVPTSRVIAHHLSKRRQPSSARHKSVSGSWNLETRWFAVTDAPPKFSPGPIRYTSTSMTCFTTFKAMTKRPFETCSCRPWKNGRPFAQSSGISGQTETSGS